MPEKKKKKSSFLRSISLIGLGKEREYFLENLSALLASGMPVMEALAAVREEVKSTTFKKLIDEVIEDIESGSPMNEALHHTGAFSPHVNSLIKVGERTGRLVENLKVIAIEQQKERELRSKIRSAAMYPIFVLSLTLVVGSSIAWFILPKLATIFSQMKIPLPTLTRGMIDFGNFLNQKGTFVIPIFLASIFLLFFFTFYFSKTKIVGEIILFFTPGVKRLIKETEMARFGYLLGTLIGAGLSVVESLESLSQATSFRRYKKLYSFLSNSINDGNSFKKSFKLYKKTKGLLPTTIQQLVIAAEQSGSLSTTLTRIGENYEEKTDITTKDLTVMLEPILLLIVWIGVVLLALAVILPIYGLIGGIQAGA